MPARQPAPPPARRTAPTPPATPPRRQPQQPGYFDVEEPELQRQRDDLPSTPESTDAQQSSSSSSSEELQSPQEPHRIRFFLDNEEVEPPEVHEAIQQHEDLGLTEEEEESSEDEDESSEAGDFGRQDDDSDEDDPEDQGTRSPSPRCTRNGTRYFSAGPEYRPVTSRLFSHIRAIQDSKNLICATMDWEKVTNDPLYQQFHRVFSLYVDAKTKELLCPDQAIHPFSLSAKMDSDDYPTFREILRMDPEERTKWFESMDEELQALFESGACEFIDRSEVIKLKKEIVRSIWSFRRKRKPSGEITRLKSRLCLRGDEQRATSDYTTNETFAPVIEWVTIRLLFTLGVLEVNTGSMPIFNKAECEQ